MPAAVATFRGGKIKNPTGQLAAVVCAFDECGGGSFLDYWYFHAGSAGDREWLTRLGEIAGGRSGDGVANPQQVAYSFAEVTQRLVADGIETDCEGLVGLAGAMATIFNNTAQFVQAFGVLTPKQFASQIGGVAYNTTAVRLNTGQSSGYGAQYQNTVPDGRPEDPNWNGDQGHHFAAFFQLGYLYGAPAASAAVDLFEGAEQLLKGGPLNLGDIALGRAAVQIGADLKAGKIKPADVASKIKSLCAN